MISIKAIITAELKKMFTNVNDSYPSDWATFPVIQYIEEENNTHTKTDDKEQLMYVRYKVDIWNDRSTTESAIAVDKALSGVGLKRTQSLDVPDASQLKHKVMRFEGIINVNNMRVYNS